MCGTNDYILPYLNNTKVLLSNPLSLSGRAAKHYLLIRNVSDSWSFSVQISTVIILFIRCFLSCYIFWTFGLSITERTVLGPVGSCLVQK